MSQPLPENPPETETTETTSSRFRPGVSGNKGGRPKGLAKAVREMVEDETELARIMLIIALDTNEKTADRMTAVAWLADRGWGKAPAFAPIEDEDPLELSERQANEIATDFDRRLDDVARQRQIREERERTA